MKNLKAFISRLASLQSQNEFFIDPVRRKKAFWAGLLFILLWQSPYVFRDFRFDESARRKDATGFNREWGKHFFYYYYYLGYFPVASRADSTFKYSRAEAEKFMKEKGNTLVMEWNHWSRFGDYARVLLFYPNAILKGSPEDPKITAFNILVFNLTLLLLYVVFWKIGKPVPGFLIVLLCGSSPFLLYEIYNNQNIFGLLTSVGLLLLALHIPLFQSPFRKIHLLIPLASGLVIGFIYNVRGEILPITLSCMLVYLFSPHYKWPVSILFTVVLAGSYYFVDRSIKRNFAVKYQEALRVVQENGGHPFEGGKTTGHPFWHPFFCGLGDFDNKYGYALHDTAVYAYALPVLRRKLNLPLKYPGRTKYEMDEFYDSAKVYYKKVETIPGFEDLLKEKALRDIKNDPMWYAEIILKRINYFFSNTSPIELRLYTLNMPVPFTGYLLLPLLFLLVYCRNWFYVKMLLFTLPLGASTILIFAAYDNSFTSCYHLIALAIILTLLIERGMIYFAEEKRRKTES